VEGLSRRIKEEKEHMGPAMPKVVSRLGHYIKQLPQEQKEFRFHTQGCYKKGKWKRHSGRKQQYYIDNFNPEEEIRMQDYLRVHIHGEKSKWWSS
jgi:hypothetical protein